MNRFIPYAFLLIMLPQISMAAERDPFEPYIDTTIAIEKAPTGPVRTYSSNLVELDKYPLSSYKLIGVITSKRKSLAVIRGEDLKDFFIEVGDVLGKEKGIVEEINIEGMSVNVNNENITLPVSNKLVEDKDGKKR